MNLPHELIAAFPPSRDVLLDSTRLAIDDAMLRQIARLSDAALGKMAEWILEEESLEGQDCVWNPANPRPKAFSVEQGFWQPLAAEIKDKAATLPAGGLRTNLELCALLLET